MRLDQYLHAKDLLPSREQAKKAIKDGLIKVNNERVTKPAYLVEARDQISYEAPEIRFVGRGGHKLAKALETWSISLQDQSCLDVGASTGGFTQVMLMAGAKEVYAVDVGVDQLHDDLRRDPRVKVMEHYNFRYAQIEDFPYLFDFASVDVSFISLALILPALIPLLQEEASFMLLIKPQFEAGKASLNKKGLVTSSKVHQQVLLKIGRLLEELSCRVEGIIPSPIRGSSGNLEFLCYAKKGKQGFFDIHLVKEIVK